MKRVLLYSDCHLFGGSEYVVVNLLTNRRIKGEVVFSFAYRSHSKYRKKINELLSKEKDIECYPLTLCANYSIYDYLKTKLPKGIFIKLCFAPFFLMEKVGVYDLINKFKIRRFLKKDKYDIIHINNGGYPGARTCMIMADEVRRLNVPLIMQVNNIASDEGQRNTKKAVLNAVNIYLTASQIAKASLMKVLHVSSEKILTIPHFVDYVKPCKEKESIRKAHNINASSIVIVEVALLQQRKGQVELIKAVKLLSERYHQQIDLVLIGEGENKENIIAVIERTGQKENVHLLGYRNDYIDYLNAADVVSLPSLKDEDMPLTIISALSLGKPIVSTKLAGIPEEIENGVSGYLIDPQSESFVSDLADALYKAYQNKEELSINARKRYKDKFSKKQFEESYIKLYNSL